MERKLIEFQREEEYRLKSLAETGNNLLPELAINYSQTWANSGIIITPEQAEAKISRFKPEETHIFLDPSSKEVLGQIHTVPVYAASLKHFIELFRTYSAVERAAKIDLNPDPNFIICFSLNCRPGYFVKIGEKTIPLPEFVVKNFPAPERAYRIGFSFITMPSPEAADAGSMIKRYTELIGQPDTRGGGPAMMHEAFGGIVVAFLPNARPEHKLAGGGITLVTYPRNKIQEEYFARVKNGRRKGIIPFERYQDTIILKDVQILTPLRNL